MKKHINIFHRKVKVKILVEVLVVKLILALLLGSIYVLQPGITGFFAVSQDVSYTDNLNLEFSKSENYTWIPNNFGELKSIKLDGTLTKDGRAKVYIEKDNIRYLIFDSNNLAEESSGIASITGFAISETEDISVNLIGNLTTEQESFTNLLVEDIAQSKNNVDITLDVKKNQGNNKSNVKEKSNGVITSSQQTLIDILITLLENSTEELTLSIVSSFPFFTNTPPDWISSENSFELNNTLILDLTTYFSDADGDSLTYSTNNITNVSISMSGSIITIIPDLDLDMVKQLTISAYDGKNITFKTVSLIINTLVELNDSIEKKINITLDYGDNEFYDSNNDGIETFTGVIDLTTKANFNWEANESNLCTRYEIYSEENKESNFLCYGSSNCCAFANLQPSRDSWNESLLLTYGSYGSTNNNVISSQVIYLDSNNGEPILSLHSDLSAKFEDNILEYKNKCVETCAINNFNESSYKLIVEIYNGTLNIENINYVVEENFQKEGPVSIKNIENITLFMNQNYTLNLSQYFLETNNLTLNYTYLGIENVSISFEGDIAYIVSTKNFIGTRFTYITANNSFEIENSNVFKIEVKNIEIVSNDSCICPSSGDWIGSFSDSCSISTNCDLGGNSLIISGQGEWEIDAVISNFDKFVVHGGRVVCRRTDGCFG